MLKIVQPGDPIRAASYNVLVRAHQARASLHGGAGISGQVIGITALAVNSGTTMLDAHAVATVTGQTYAATDFPENKTTIVPTINLAAAGDVLDYIAIPLEQIKAGTLGRVCFSGICWAKYDGSAGDRGAAVEGSDQLTLSDAGPAEVLDTNATVGLALIRFGGGGSGGSVVAHSHTTADWGFVPSWFGN